MPLSPDPERLATAAFAGNRRALARLITLVEEDGVGAGKVLAAAHGARRGAYRVGITGAPGAGKSTITDRLVVAVRERGEEVAVLAVDPSSPFSGGAVLGDRVRMQEHASDPGVYIRSMASRGHLGGLSAAVPKALALLDAAGFPMIIIETVGVGQDEVEVAEAADTAVVVVVPGWGDWIQAAKAGLLEIGDIFVVNKADRAGVDEAVADLHTMIEMGEERSWRVPILTTVASRSAGIVELLAQIDRHRCHLEEGEGLNRRRRKRRLGELAAALHAAAARRAVQLSGSPEHGDLVSLVESGELDPWSAAERLVAG